MLLTATRTPVADAASVGMQAELSGKCYEIKNVNSRIREIDKTSSTNNC